MLDKAGLDRSSFWNVSHFAPPAGAFVKMSRPRSPEESGTPHRDRTPSCQPLLHELVGVVCAPTSALGGATGRSGPAGVQGVFHADARVLSRAVLRVDERELEAVDPRRRRPGRRTLRRAWPAGSATPPPTPPSASTRLRRATRNGLHRGAADRLHRHCRRTGHRRRRPRLRPGTHRGGQVRRRHRRADGHYRSARHAHLVGHRDRPYRHRAGRRRARRRRAGHRTRLAWPVDLPPGGETVAALAVDGRRPARRRRRPGRASPSGADPRSTADDRRLGPAARPQPWTTCAALRLAETARTRRHVPRRRRALVPHPVRPGQPLGRPDAAAARHRPGRRHPARAGPPAGHADRPDDRRGARQDPARAAPRRVRRCRDDGLRLPPVYYGTVDATLLWVSLLHDAWRWGMPAEAGRAPCCRTWRRRCGWLGDHADPDGDGFVEYVDSTGHGLANQGWKDSGDAVRFRDGTLATAPIALCEVQGVRVRGRAGRRRPAGRVRPTGRRPLARVRAPRWPSRFRETLLGRRTPRAVPGAGPRRRQAAGRLADQQHRPPARHRPARPRRGGARSPRLLAPTRLAGGFGLRTMSSDDAGLQPAVVPLRLDLAARHRDRARWAGPRRAPRRRAAALADGLLSAAEAFDYRMPELYGGDDRGDW